jgi:hypothetical protein
MGILRGVCIPPSLQVPGVYARHSQEPTNQAVAKNSRFDIKGHSLWYRLCGRFHKAPRITRVPPVARREMHPKISDGKIRYRLIKVLGLPVSFPTNG